MNCSIRSARRYKMLSYFTEVNRTETVGGRTKGSSCVQNKVVGLSKRAKKNKQNKNRLKQINNVQLGS